MSNIVVRARKNGPFVFEVAAGITLVDHEGNAFTLPADKPMVALCRCGQSSRKPFCDGTHNKCGFLAEELAPKQTT